MKLKAFNLGMMKLKAFKLGITRPEAVKLNLIMRFEDYMVYRVS